MPSSLRLQTLGSPLLFTAAGDPVRLRTRKHFALLIRLALEPAKRFTRDYLMDLLWSDAPSRKASHSLAQALSVLRAKVGREAVHVHRATVALGAGAVEVDTAGLAGAETEIRGPFLEGFEIPRAAEFEQWKDEWRAKLLPQVRDCLVRQMDAARRTADFGIVERRAQTLLDLDPLSEDAVRGLMEGRAWVGDRTGALKVYSTFETLVAQDLGAKPSADLARTASLLREGRRPLLKPGEPPQARVLPDRRFEPETLIGRQREFSVLYDAWLDVRRKQPRVVGVIGDPGIGKTTLTNAFLSTCQMDGAIVARTQAYDAERELPFAVLAEVVRQLLAFQGAIASADPDALSELSRIAPEVRAAFPGVPKPIDWGAEVTPLRLADAFLKTLTAAADESPVVVVVDDVHAADNASVAILHLVARKLPQARLMFVFPARPGELRAAAAPVSLLSDSAIVGLRTLELEALTDAASAELLRQVTARTEARHGPPPIERVLRSCRGNPLAIELLTREWLEHGAGSLVRDLEALDAVPAATVGIPRAIKAVFDRQVLRLDPKTRSVLDLAAVLGRRIGDFPIYEVVSRTAGEAAETMARLVEEGFLHDARGALEFRNELIRAQAYYAVAAPVRQHLHREVATVLARRAGDTPGAAGLEVAWHLLRSGDAARATTFALAGAHAALEVGAPYEAEKILAAVLDHPADKDAEVRLLLAQALIDQSKGDRVRELLDPPLNRAVLDAKGIARAHWMEARAEFLVKHASDEPYCDAARLAVKSAIASGDPDLQATALFEYAYAAVESGQLELVQQASDQLTALLDSGNGRSSCMANYALAYCEHALDDLELASAHLSRAAELVGRSPVLASRIHTATASVRHYLCQFRAAENSLASALDLANRIGDDVRASIILSNLCVVTYTQGRFAEGLSYGDDALVRTSRALSQPYIVSTHLCVALANAVTGKRSLAESHLEEAEAHISAHSSWLSRIQLLSNKAELALVWGNLPLALDFIRQAEDLAHGREGAVPSSDALGILRILNAGHTRSAQETLELSRSLADQRRTRHPLGYLDAVCAVAWAERRVSGQLSERTQKDLRLFDTYSAYGKRAFLIAEGFITLNDVGGS